MPFREISIILLVANAASQNRDFVLAVFVVAELPVVAQQKEVVFCDDLALLREIVRIQAFFHSEILLLVCFCISFLHGVIDLVDSGELEKHKFESCEFLCLGDLQFIELSHNGFKLSKLTNEHVHGPQNQEPVNELAELECLVVCVLVHLLAKAEQISFKNVQIAQPLGFVDFSL